MKDSHLQNDNPVKHVEQRWDVERLFIRSCAFADLQDRRLNYWLDSPTAGRYCLSDITLGLLEYRSPTDDSAQKYRIPKTQRLQRFSRVGRDQHFSGGL